MTTKHLVDPELIPLLGAFPALQLTHDVLRDTRAAMNAMFAEAAKTAPAFPNVEVMERRITGPDGAPDVRVLVYRPTKAGASHAGIVWIHGGGYVIGTADMDDVKVKSIVDELGCVVVSVDYRLSPETAHPGPVEDCYAALTWLHRNADELRVDRARIAVGGESAGGGLAATLALLTRDRREISLAFQLLIYPMLDDRTVTADSPHPHTGEFIWTPALNHFGWSALLGREPGSRGVSPYAAAARAEDLGGLPPTFLAVGSLDLFLEEDLEYARRLTRAAVPTELHVYPGAYHAFQMAADAAVSKAYTRDFTSALRRALRKA